MIKIHLLTTNPEMSGHWASAYGNIRRAFGSASDIKYLLIDEPDKADLIITCPEGRNNMFPVELFSNRIFRNNRDRSLVFSTCDDIVLFFPGIYTSIGTKNYNQHYFRSGFYPHVAFDEHLDCMSVKESFKYLFSFVGRFDTHPIRNNFSNIGHTRGSIQNTTKHGGYLNGQSHEVYKNFKNKYIDSLRFSKFILCPRGAAPTSVRLFEAMKAQRVPVIISDDWVRPMGIPWEDFAIFINESDILSIPLILEAEEVNFNTKAKRAREVWREKFSAESMPSTIVEWGLSLLNDMKALHTTYVPFSQYYNQVISLKFLRRGIISELTYLTKNMGQFI